MSKRTTRRPPAVEPLESRLLLTVTPGIMELDGTQLTNNQTISWQAGIALHVRAVDNVDANHNATGPTTFTGTSNPNNTNFQWDFGDTAALTDPDYTSGVRSAHNSETGFNAAHIYDTPGTYALKLTTTDDAGNVSAITVNVQVSSSTLGSSHSDVNVVDGNVLYVDAVNGNDAWTGTAPSRVGTTTDGPLKTFAGALNFLLTQPGWNTNVQIRFKRGQTFDVHQADYQGTTLGGTNVILGAYGSTTLAKPVLNCADTGLTAIISPNGSTGSMVDWTIQDVTFASSVANPNHTSYGDAARLAGSDISLRNVDFGNHVNDIWAHGDCYGVLVQDCSDHGNWCNNYALGCIVKFNDWVVVGSSFTGASYNFGASTGHQPFIRFESVSTNNNGRILFANNVVEPLACNSAALTFREDSGTGGHTQNFLYVVGNTISGGLFNFQFKGGNVADYLENWTVADSNTLIDSTISVGNCGDHVMYRNNLVEKDDADTTDPDFITESSMGSTVGSTGFGTEDIQLINNTMYTTRTGSFAGRFNRWMGNFWHDTVVANNLLVAPNATPSSYAQDFYVPSTGEMARVSDNVWTDPKGDGSGLVVEVNGGTDITVANWNANYRRGINAAWSASSYDDVAANVSLDGSFAPIGTTANVGAPISGVWADMNGKPRTAGTWTVGAVDTISVNAPTNLSAAAVSPSQINLAWTDNSNNETGFAIDRATNSSFTQNLTTINVGANVTSYNDTGRSASTTYYYRVRALGSPSNSPNSATASATTPSYGTFSTDTDIGSPSPAGSANYNSSTGTYTVAGGGADIWNASDQFNFLSKSYSGDGAIVARVTSVTNTSSWAKAGVMFRDSLAANAMYVDVIVTPGQGVSFQYRSATGGNCVHTDVTGITAPEYVRLVRSGNTFTGYYSSDGSNWTQIGSTVTIAMSSTAQLGLAVTAHNNGSLCTASFTNLSIYGRPSAPTNLAATVASSTQVNLTWTDNSVVETNYIVDRATDSAFTQNLSTATLPANTTSYSSTGLTNGTTYYYRVLATNVVGDSPNSATVSATPTPQKLSGTIIGTSGSYQNQGNVIAKAFDGDFNTFFDSPTANGGWLGLDLGTPTVVTQVKYAPRSGFASRMVGGMFQASNTADFSSGVVTLFTITATPPVGVFTTQAIGNTTAYRYYRYIGADGSYCNVSELEFDA
jgi:hypothetical protein